MEAQEEHVYKPPSLDVIIAQRELARLSQQAGYGISDGTGSLSKELLNCLLRLCSAQRGAIFLATQPLIETQPSMSVGMLQRMLRPFALTAMRDDEALVQLDHIPLEETLFQFLPSEPCWLIYRIEMSSPSTEMPDRTTFPLYAFVILGWVDQNTSSVEHARVLIPEIAESIGAAIVNLLLSERVHDLEGIVERKALRDMELLKAELLATVSHELRSPLASIKGYASTLLRHEHRIPREERHEFLLAINEASDRLEVVVNRLLEMSQLETGTITIEKAPVNLAYLVREAMIAAQRQSAEVNEQAEALYRFHIRLEDERGMPTEDEPVIMADRLRLREVLDNLLENASHYSPEGGAVEVVLRPVTQPEHIEEEDEIGNNSSDKGRTLAELNQQGRHMIEICVRDTGIGIPEEQLKRIFERFHRVDIGLTREVNGLGLGLTICKRIVELHDGMIWAESQPGRGSTFYVRLPIL